MSCNKKVKIISKDRVEITYDIDGQKAKVYYSRKVYNQYIKFCKQLEKSAEALWYGKEDNKK